MSFFRLTNGLLTLDDGGLAVLCDCCPCPDAWYIATFCPCDLCGDAPLCFVGGEQKYPTDPADPLYDAEFAGQDVTVDGEQKLYALTLGSDETPDCMSIGLDCYLQAITHTTPPAPFSGTVNALVKIGGESVGSWEGSCINGESLKLGDQSFDEGIPYAAIETKRAVEGGSTTYRFLTVGMTHIDIAVEFSSAGEDTVRYSHRIGVRVIGGEVEGAAVGSVFIAEDWMATNKIYADCAWKTEDGVPLKTSVLLGPYRTKALAQDYLELYSELIHEWAEKCQCEKRCKFERSFSPPCMANGYPPEADLSDCGGVDECEPAPGGCDDAWIDVYEWVITASYHPDPFTLEARLYNSNNELLDVVGSVSSPTSAGPDNSIDLSGLKIPPCHYVLLYIVNDGQPFPAPLFDYIGSFGNARQYGQPDPCPYDTEEFETLEEYIASLEV